MQIKRGANYWIRNVNTNEYSQINITDVFDHLGHYVVGGVISRHEIHVVKGVQNVGERYSAFTVIRDIPDELIKVFTAYLRGGPLALCDSPSPALAKDPYVGGQILIVNSSRTAWGKADGVDKVARLDRAKRAIDLFLYMSEHGRPPRWFLALRHGANGT